MTSIAERQNLPASIGLLAAMRHAYTLAKRYRGTRVGVSVGLAVLGPVVVLVREGVAGWLGAAAGACLAVDRFVLRPFEASWVRTGAAVQEMFDVDVLDLPWNDAKGQQPTPMKVSGLTAKHFNTKRQQREAALLDWYPDTNGLDRPMDVLLCQQSGLNWHERLVEEWLTVQQAALFFVLAAGGVIAAAEQLTLVAYLAGLLLPSMPAIIELLDVRDQHGRHRDRVTAALRRVMALLDRAVLDDAVTDSDCRAIQDTVWDLRAEPHTVPNWYYRLRRASHELEMTAAAATLKDRVARRRGQ